MVMMAATEDGRMRWKMTPDYSSKLLRKLSITRVAFGLAMSALIAFGALMRMDLPNTWPLIRGLESPKLDPRPLNRAIQQNSLLADFDSVCASRTQQNRFRKKEHHHPMSQSLVQALAQYTQLHARCALAYSEEVKTGCQYLVYYEGYEGLGNRLLSLVSAFVYALVTQRTLVLDDRRGHLGQLLCEPFQNSSWLLPSYYRERYFPQPMTLEDATSRHFVNVTAVQINLRHHQSPGDRRFFCVKSQKGLRNVTWLVWESNQYYVPRLFMVYEFWATLHPLFPDVSLIFTQLSRFLCLPRNSVWDRIQNIQESDLSPSRVQVGIQVRRHGVPDNASFSTFAHRHIMDCLLHYKILPKPLVSHDVENSHQTTESNSKRRPTVAVLVTSLQSYHYEKMQESYTKIGTEDGSLVRFHMVTHEGSEQFSYDQAAKAFVEMWLLSYSDKLATSSWSTFGYVAQGLGGIYPYILNIRGDVPNQDDLPPCSVAQSREPCLHYPYVKHSLCVSDKTDLKHTGWVARHIKHCQDETRGLQLCSNEV